MNDKELKDSLDVFSILGTTKIDNAARDPIPDEIIREFRSQIVHDQISAEGIGSSIKDLEQEIVKLKQERDAYIAFLNKIILDPLARFAKRYDIHSLATSIVEGIKDGTIDCECLIQDIWCDFERGKKDPYYTIGASYKLSTKNTLK